MKVEFVESLSIGVENNYLNSSVCEDASACVGSSFSNGISEPIPGSFSLCFFAAISSASVCMLLLWLFVAFSLFLALPLPSLRSLFKIRVIFQSTSTLFTI